MDEGAGERDTDMGTLLMLGFSTQHPTVSCGTERPHLPPLGPCRRDKILPWDGRLSRNPVFSRPFRQRNRATSITYVCHTRPTPNLTREYISYPTSESEIGHALCGRGTGRVEFSPAMVAGRAGSGALRPGAGGGVSAERTRAAGSGEGRTWLRALATTGPWLRWPAGRQ